MKKDANGSGGAADSQEAVVLHFKASVARAAGRFKATAPEFSSLGAYGDTQDEALAALESAILKHLSASASLSFEAVFEEAAGVVPYAALAHGENLYVATNLDMVLVSGGGPRETFRRSSVTQQSSEVFQVLEDDRAESILEPDEYSTQIYSLAAYTTPIGVAGLYAGTNLKGLVYVREGEEEWRPAFSTGEERVHGLAAFGEFLYAGTSSEGKLFRWDGRHRTELVHQTTDMGITALAVFGGALYAGTYPEGLILRSEEGELWEIVCRTQFKMVNQFLVTADTLYAGLSDEKGGAVLRTRDGADWERSFFSEKDLNVYSLAYFGGRIYAGTGDSGRLFSSQDGQHWEEVMQSPETALRVLAAHKGRLYVGTAQRGRLYRTAQAESPAPTITRVEINQLTSSRAVLEWATDVPCEAHVQFGVDAVRDQTISNASLSRQHRATLEGLKAGTRYTFLIRARNAQGSEAVHLSEKGFATPIMQAPALASSTHPEEDRWYGSRQVRVAWSPIQGAAGYVTKLDRQRITSLTAGDSRPETTSFLADLESDGVWWFAAAGVDEAGNVGDVAVRALRCDTAAAVPSVSSPSHADPSSWSGVPVVELKASGTDDASGVDFFMFAIGRVGESWEHLAFQQASGTSFSLPRLPDGAWEVFVKLRDRAGNESRPTSLRIQIDTSPPIVALDPVPAIAKAGPMELTWQARDEMSGIGRISVQQRREGTGSGSDEWETVYEGKGESVKVEGRDGWRMWYRVIAEDGAGMRSAAASLQPVLFDGSPPLPVTIMEASSLAGGDVLLKWAPARDEFSEVARYVIYRGSEEGKLGMKIATVTANVLEFVDDGVGLAHGSRYYYRVGSEDSFGNSQAEGVTVAGTCDKEATPPQLKSSTHAPEEWSSLTEAILEWDPPSDTSGIKEYVWRLDRNPVSTLVKGVDESLAGPPLKISHVQDGLWYVHVASIDGAGNMSTPATYALRVVTRPPHARLKALPSMVNSRKVRLEWEREEGVVAAAIGVRTGGERGWQVLVEQAEGNVREVEVESEGVFEFSVRAHDTFGRWGVWEEGQVTLVDTSPPLEIPILEAKILPGGKILLQWDPSWDELSGLAYYRVRRTRQGESRAETIAEVPATSECVFLDNCEGVEEGSRFVYAVWPVDMAGNVMEAGPLSEAVCDRSAPIPRLVCRSHPDPTRFYSSRKVEILWDSTHDLTGVKGIVVEWNGAADTEPNPETLPLRSAQTLTFDVPEDGRWFVHARTVDGAGNASEAAHISFQVDTHVDPPVISFVSDPFLELQESGSVAVAVKPPEDLSGAPAFWYVLDQSAGSVVDRTNGTREEGAVLRVKPKSEGVWHLHVAAEDGAGNMSESVHLTMRLQTGLSMPRMVNCSHPEGFWSQKREVEMEWERVEGDRVSYLYWLAEKRQEAPPESAMRIEEEKCRITLDEGMWYWHVCATDERGRKSSPLAYQIRIDVSPPVVSVSSSSHPKEGWSTRRRVQYMVEADDSVSGVGRLELAVTPEGREPDVWELALGGEGEREVPGEGQWTIWARAVDASGNVSHPASWNIRVDTSAPAPGISSASHPAEGWSDSLHAEFLLQPGEDLSGVAEYRFHLFRSDEEIPQEPPEEASNTTDEIVHISVPGDGRWLLAVWAKDLADNMSSPTRYAFAVDSSAAPPAGFVVEPSGEGGWIRSSSVQVFWRHPEEISGEPEGYIYCLDRQVDTVPYPESGLYAATPELGLDELDDGINYLHVRTLDVAGNLSEAVHLKLSLDGRPPLLTLSVKFRGGEVEASAGSEGAATDWTRDRHVTIESDASDSISGVTGFLWTLHDKGKGEEPDIMNGRWREEPSWKVEIPEDGVWEIAVAAQDGAGNMSSPARAIVKVDAAASPPQSFRAESHPESERWYSSREVTLNWEEPPEVSGVVAYRYHLCPAGGVAAELSEWARASRPPLKIEVPEDGAWVVSIATEDGAGNVSGPVRAGFMVDSRVDPPRLTVPTHPDPDVSYSSGVVDLAVGATDDASGIRDILVAVGPDENPASNAYRPFMGARTALNLEKGTWWIAACAVDNAGNRSEPARRRVIVDPAVKPPLVVCESHPEPEVWYANSEVTFSLMPAAEGAASEFLAVFDNQPSTQPMKANAFPAGKGALKVSAMHSGEWYLHVVSVTSASGPATEAVHAKVRVDTTVPEAPVISSTTHLSAPRRSRAHNADFIWTPPADVAGIKSYSYSLSRKTLMGMRRDKGGTLSEPSVSLSGLEQGVYELTVAATDGADNTGAPGRHQFVVSDTQDLVVNVKSESWRVGQSGFDLDLVMGQKSVARGRTDGTGGAAFRNLNYGTYSLTLTKGKSSQPLELEGLIIDDGEPQLELHVSTAGCAWLICRDAVRLWVPKMCMDGGYIDILGQDGEKVSTHSFKDLSRIGGALACPLPPELPEGSLLLSGGALAKLSWPALPFTRSP